MRKNDLLKLIEHKQFPKNDNKKEIETIAIQSNEVGNSDSLGIGLRLLGLGTILGPVTNFLTVETN